MKKPGKEQTAIQGVRVSSLNKREFMPGVKKPKVIVVTGASSGIGRKTAEIFAGKGDHVVLAARSEESLNEVADCFKSSSGEALVVPADVSDENQVKNLAAKALGKFGRIDCWVNNAGVITFGSFEDTPDEDFRRVIETNLFGYVYGARAVIPQFKKQKYGHLINVASVAGVVGQPYSVPYSISKFGIRGLGLSLDQELKDEKNIHINTLMPSTVDTPIYDKGGNYVGKKISPPVTVIKAEKVAKTIVKLCDKPKKNVFVGKQTLLMRIGRFVAPTIFDKIVYWKTIIQEFQKESIPLTKGNLYEPMPEQNKISGGWTEER